jgi:hypothetical protein
VYRPTVRYDDVFREYVDDVFKSTTLDRNQIIRLALFAAPFNNLFVSQLEKHLKINQSSLPSTPWEVWDHGYWRDQNFIPQGEREDVNISEGGDVIGETMAERRIEISGTDYPNPGRIRNVDSQGSERTAPRREGKVRQRPSDPTVFGSSKGIKITLG